MPARPRTHVRTKGLRRTSADFGTGIGAGFGVGFGARTGAGIRMCERGSDARIKEFAARPRPECAPATLPQDAPRALNFHGGRGNRPKKEGSVFGQVGEARTGSRTLRTGSAERSAYAQSGRRSSPPGPVRRPRGCRRRCPPAHWIQCSGPTHAESMEALPPWPEKSARTGARPHSGSTSQRCVHPQNFRTDHNPAIRNNAP